MTAPKSRDEQLRRRQVAGLLMVLAVVVAWAIYRAGVGQIFPRGWWHFW